MGLNAKIALLIFSLSLIQISCDGPNSSPAKSKTNERTPASVVEEQPRPDDGQDEVKEKEKENTSGPSSLPAPSKVEVSERGDSLTASPPITWKAVDGALGYRVAIGTSPGGKEVLDWTEVGNKTAFSAISLTMKDGEIYYASVVAYASIEVVSAVAVSEGWQNLKCPDGYVKIVGTNTNGLGGPEYTQGSKSIYDWDLKLEKIRKISDFCVMKYEARDSGSGQWAARAVSQPQGLPWPDLARTKIGEQNDAVEACTSKGVGYILAENNHWQTIGRDIESVSENYNSLGPVADHAFNRGNSDPLYSTRLPADPDDKNGCFGLQANTFDAQMVSADCGGVWHLNKRTHKLSSGAIIWDFSGNSFEWVRDDNLISQGDTALVNTDPYTDKLKWGPKGDYSAQTTYGAGLGLFASSTTGAVIRGAATHVQSAGMFYTTLFYASDTESVAAFRCVYVP